ncbi:hypothetical protein BN906_01929 [Clostridium tetani 12124569]|nr:hypothetical protein BN906_01929 [Clostridium tetani 12124569]
MLPGDAILLENASSSNLLLHSKRAKKHMKIPYILINGFILLRLKKDLSIFNDIYISVDIRIKSEATHKTTKIECILPRL